MWIQITQPLYVGQAVIKRSIAIYGKKEMFHETMQKWVSEQIDAVSEFILGYGIAGFSQ